MLSFLANEKLQPVMGVIALLGLGLCIDAFLSNEHPTVFAWTLVAIPTAYYFVLLTLVLMFKDKETRWTAEDELEDQKRKHKYAMDRLNKKLEARENLKVKIRFGTADVGIMSMLTHDIFYFMTDMETDAKDAAIDQQIIDWFKSRHDLRVRVIPERSDFGPRRIVELVDVKERL
ncbi:MAG: hypothetical protein NPIRA05_10470 [Nitrospirales bacterium]|nr:MAG: hypothetical protein NPIRA05_10470 [Nitrospirales bacterium]